MAAVVVALADGALGSHGVDQVEELPEGFYVSGRMHRECAEAMIDAMRAECPICQGDHDGGHDVSGDS